MNTPGASAKPAVTGGSMRMKQGIPAKHSLNMPKSKKKKVIVGALLGMMMKNNPQKRSVS